MHRFSLKHLRTFDWIGIYKFIIDYYIIINLFQNKKKQNKNENLNIFIRSSIIGNKKDKWKQLNLYKFLLWTHYFSLSQPINQSYWEKKQQQQ